MTFYGVRPRPILGAVTALLSVASGFVLVFRLLTPGTLDRIPTPVLLGVLALLALPLLTVWAFFIERRAATRAAELSTGVIIDDSGIEGLAAPSDDAPAQNTDVAHSPVPRSPSDASTAGRRSRTRIVRARTFPTVHTPQT
jgi:hypothetical protein